MFFFSAENVLWLVMKLRMAPHLREKLLPKGKLGCLRPLLADDYFRIFEQSNVYLHKDPITRIDKDSLTTENGVTQKIDARINIFGQNQNVLNCFSRF